MLKYILHVPHSSTFIPNHEGFNQSLIQHEINLLTDWDTDLIFNIPDADKVIAKHCRIFCDVERLADEFEPMFPKGMGICYTHTDDLRFLRYLKPAYKQSIIDQFYLPHHQALTNLVTHSLANTGQAFIIDCHSFSSTPLKRELDQSLDRPDICLGTDLFHTPRSTVEFFTSFFAKHGLKVAENKPYSGTIVPLEYYQKEPRVSSIMIEVNKKLYMDETTFIRDQAKILYLRTLIEELCYSLNQHA